MCESVELKKGYREAHSKTDDALSAEPERLDADKRLFKSANIAFVFYLGFGEVRKEVCVAFRDEFDIP